MRWIIGRCSVDRYSDDAQALKYRKPGKIEISGSTQEKDVLRADLLKCPYRTITPGYEEVRRGNQFHVLCM